MRLRTGGYSTRHQGASGKGNRRLWHESISNEVRVSATRELCRRRRCRCSVYRLSDDILFVYCMNSV